MLLVLDLQGYPIEQLEETIAFLREHRIAPESEAEEYEYDDRLTFVPLLVVVNKCDDESMCEEFEVLRELLGSEYAFVPYSATTGRNALALRRAVFDALDLMRVYSKPPGRPPDLTQPFVLPRESTVEELASKVHHDFYEQLKSARVWGSGVFDGQMVGRDHVLVDGDIVELRM
jgi:ribosome-interacting GTPase 1